MREHPEIIYKYRSWSNDIDKNILLKNQLFFASPKYFNDPFDCRIPLDFFLLDSAEKIDTYIDKIISVNFDKLLQRGVDINKGKEKYRDKLLNSPDIFQEEFNKLYFTSVDNHFGIFSASVNWDNLLMWSHYANQHKGFCIGINQNKIKVLCKDIQQSYVYYPKDDSFPSINPIESESPFSVITQTTTKSNNWDYEEEYRLIMLFYSKIPSDEDRCLIIPNDFISEIIIGLNSSSETKTEIVSIAKRKNIKVYEAYQEPFKFKINKRELY